MNDSRFSERTTPVLIYDAECRLCVFSKKIMQTWDAKNKIRFLPFQNKEAVRLSKDLATMQCMDAMRFVDANGSVSSGINAFRNMLPSLPMGQALAFIFKWPGVYTFTEKIYRIIAKNRIAWFGKCHCM
jgi:predicted DCC family thiol-disulfide oxidoreductase YuxK